MADDSAPKTQQSRYTAVFLDKESSDKLKENIPPRHRGDPDKLNGMCDHVTLKFYPSAGKYTHASALAQGRLVLEVVLRSRPFCIDVSRNYY